MLNESSSPGLEELQKSGQLAIDQTTSLQDVTQMTLENTRQSEKNPDHYAEEIIREAERIQIEPVNYEQMLNECQERIKDYFTRSLHKEPTDPRVVAAVKVHHLVHLADVTLRMLQIKGEKFATKAELFQKMEEMIANPASLEPNRAGFTDKDRANAVLWAFRLGRYGLDQFYQESADQTYDGPHSRLVEGMRDRLLHVSPRVQTELPKYIEEIQKTGMPKVLRLRDTANWPDEDQRDIEYVLLNQPRPLEDLSEETKQRQVAEFVMLYANARDRVGILSAPGYNDKETKDHFQLLQEKYQLTLRRLGLSDEEIFTQYLKYLEPYRANHDRFTV